MDERVTLVIPGRNCAATLSECLASARPLKLSGLVDEIIFVDDASTDDTRSIADRFDIRVLSGPGRGAAAARNVGWRAAKSPRIWFVDSDCVIEPGTLEKLLAEFDDDRVGAVGGSYSNRRPDSLLACLIHEEIIVRHESMPSVVDFLGGFNVVYRRSALEAVGGFDERFPGATAEDADLSFRVRKRGYELRFAPAARVCHFHETSLRSYLRTQRRHGIWRVRLHLLHRKEGLGNDYSGVLDPLQPPTALLTLATLPLFAMGGVPWSPVIPLTALLLMQLPMMWRMVRGGRSASLIAFVGLGFLRSFWRGVGLVQGLLSPSIRRG